MFNSTYEVLIEGKDVKRFIKSLYKNKINLLSINYDSNSVYIKIDKKDYLKLMDIKTIYEIRLIRVFGLAKLNVLFKRYFVFLCSLLFGLVLLFTLSNIIFEVEVVHNKKDIRKMLYKELSYYGIDKYHFSIPFSKQQKIVEIILKNNKSRLEWLEIERVGVKYIVRVEERIIKTPNKETGVRNIIANKDGIIKRVDASKGEIVKKINDYVKKGDIIISGNIMKGEEVKSKVSATGKAFAEVWYEVTVDMPLVYKEETKTGNNKHVFTLSFLNRKFSLIDFKPYKNKKIKEKVLSYNSLIPIKLSFNYEEELNVIDEIYTVEEAEGKAMELAKDKLIMSLGEEDKILLQKKLKSEAKDSKIIMTVFFKVYEDITSYGEIVETEETEEENR